MAKRFGLFQFHIFLTLAVLLFGLESYAQEEKTDEEGKTPVTEDRRFLLLKNLQRIKESGYELEYKWGEGLYFYGPFLDNKLRLNLLVNADAGAGSADNSLEQSFSGLDESDIGFRRFRLQLNGTFYDALEYRFYFDFANVRSVKDIWVRYLKNDVLKRFRWGYMKEPFSLEWNTSSLFIPFMERALPVDLLAPARDFGVLYDDASSDKRFSWHLGAFLVTGSLGDVGEVKDQISEYYGTSISGRFTYLPWYKEDGKDLLHLGLNLRYENEESGAEDAIRYSGRPETFLLDERLIDTGEFEAEAVYGLGLEAAKVHGPMTFQAEYLQNFLDAPDVGNPTFWGFYLYAGYFLTGENRDYVREGGVFSGIEPNRDFHLRGNRGWGAWELGLRASYVDMNSGKIQGGKEVCYTAGLNWYWNPTTRIMLNFIRTKVEDRGTPPAIDSGRANILQTRFQILF